MAANIRVAVRVRPENSRELAGNFDNVINVVDERMLIFDPKQEDDAFYYQGKKQNTNRDLNKRQKKDQSFAFDAVYAPGSTNKEVFEGTTKDLVSTIFSGYNCSVFAYGATGAGKTFTMLGGRDQPGITFLTMKEIYTHIESVSEEKTCEIGISYLEVYNETVMDLLNPGSQNLNVREDGKVTNIPGLTLHKPSGPEEILSLLSFGNSNRTQHATDANSESSRSHAVLQVFLKQKDKSAGISAEVKVAKLSLIDLAGSEKGSVTTGKTAARFREGSNINKSLLALGNCINALADGAKYIPYRNSKLTRLLKDSIGGNCRTVMIANVSPSAETFEDTYNTLRYADRAKKIKINLKANVLNVNLHVAQYAKIVEDLRGEIAALKERIAELEEENERIKNQESRRQQIPSDSQDMQVDSTQGSEITAITESCSAHMETNSAEMEHLIKTLDRYIERQADYDLLKSRITEWEIMEEERKKEMEEGRSKITQLEAQLGQISQDRQKEMEDMSEDPLVRQLSAHTRLVEQYIHEQKSVTNLRLWIHFKNQLNARNQFVTITVKDREKQDAETAKIVGNLIKKVKRAEIKLSKLVEEMAKSSQEVRALIEAASSWKAKFAASELERIELVAKTEVATSTAAIMGTKIESLDGDLNSCLEMLRKNHLNLRGHDLATAADKKDFEDLRGRILELKQVHWGGKEDDQVCVQSSVI